MRTISLRLDAASDALLRALCERLQATQTDVVRQALERLAHEITPTPGALGAELGLVGVFASGARDLGAGHSAAVKEKLVAQRVEQQRSAPDDARGKRPSRATKR